MLSQKVRFPSFLQLCSILSCKSTTVFSIHSTTNGHFSCFQILATVNSAAMNIGVHMFFWIGILGSLGYISRIRITGCALSKRTFLKNFFRCSLPNSDFIWSYLSFPLDFRHGLRPHSLLLILDILKFTFLVYFHSSYINPYILCWWQNSFLWHPGLWIGELCEKR